MYELRGVPNTLSCLPEHDLDPTTVNQIRETARLPWIHSIRVMPDAHAGIGATVGSVIAMKEAVAPSAVGVDIGCGMAAVPTNLTTNDLPDSLHALRLGIEAAVPVGFNGHESPVRNVTEAARLFNRFGDLRVDVGQLERRAANQCGTLGGGNHFIEVCADDNGAIWVMLHSGSRNIGKELAERHIKKAKGLEHNAPWGDMAVFLSDTDEMQNYLHDLHWAQDYARINRTIMLRLVKDVVRQHFPAVEYGDDISCHHNYVSHEVHHGQELIVTRKGAISAQRDEMGLIPGSMGTGSYVVRGTGYEDALCSASHGAGRKLSRGAAKRTFTVEDLAEQTRGVECRKDQGVLDEIPGAYKNLEMVMAAQTKQVEVVAHLNTLLCVKG